MPEPSHYLIVGTPSIDGKLMGPYVSSMLKLHQACAQKGVRFDVLVHSGDALIPRARQDMVARFMEQEQATHLLFIDSDIGFEPEQVFRLLDFGADVSAGVCPHKWMDPERLKALVREGKGRPDSAALTYVYEPVEQGKAGSRDGFMKARFAGTGFLMLKRTALLSMMKRYPETRYSSNFGPEDPLAGSRFRFALFNCMIDPKTGEYLSEDYSFCHRWLGMGGEIWVDTNSRFRHMGLNAVDGDFSTQLDRSASG